MGYTVGRLAGAAGLLRGWGQSDAHGGVSLEGGKRVLHEMGGAERCCPLEEFRIEQLTHVVAMGRGRLEGWVSLVARGASVAIPAL